MATDCDHDKARLTVDGPDGKRKVCPICDDVQVETLDDGES